MERIPAEESIAEVKIIEENMSRNRIA